MLVQPAPPSLGRGVVTLPGRALPAPFDDLPLVLVDDAAVAEPAALVSLLHDHWLRRRPVRIDLAADPGPLRAAPVDTRLPHEVGVGFEFTVERLQFLVWNNNVDWRGDEPVWWWARKAERAFPGRVTLARAEEAGDVMVDGMAVWCDGGPAQELPAEVGGLLHADAIDLRVLALARATEDDGSAVDLAPDQRGAVEHAVGPARIVAPAGSGKTRVLTARLRYLVARRQWPARSIVALAYNKRAAEEMQERSAGLGVDIRTLNSVALAIVNGSGGFAAPVGRPRRTVIEERQVRAFLDGLVEVKRAQNTDPIVPYLEGLRSIRLGLSTPEQAEAANDAPGLAEAFPRFQSLLDEHAAIDFDGQLYEAIRILLTDPDARAAARRRCRHLLVDEFQDLTPAHMLLVRLLAAPAYDVFAVGDDDQVIYGFAGATPRYLLDFGSWFPGAEHHALEVNYRCPPAVVEGATHLLSYNHERIVKSVRPAPERSREPGALAVRLVPPATVAPEAVELLAKWQADGVPLDEMAVLTRVNSTLLPVQVLLGEAGVPCRAAVGESILDRTGMRTALAYLRIGLEPGVISRADVIETIRRPSRRIARNVTDMLTRRPRTSLVEIRRTAGYLTGKDAERVAQYAADLDRVVTSVRRGDVASTLRLVRDEVGLGEAMDTLSGIRKEVSQSTHGDDLLALEQVASLHPDPADFEVWLRQTLRRPSPAEGGEVGIELSTVHRVKGREWDRVVVFGVDLGLLPHRLSTDEEEERRLLHVAITRCRRQCVVLSNADQPSPFLAELDGTRPQRPPRLHSRGEPDRSPERPSRRVEKASLGAPAADEGIVESLRAWRTQTAKRDGVSAFIVLSNAELLAIAAVRPTTLAELAACRGMGPVRMERWGDEMLSVLSAD